jgi:hypothetical protein
MKDYTVRMKEWFDHYLLDQPAPKWMEDGIPLLQMKDHLDSRAPQTEKPAAGGTAASASGGGQNDRE